MMTNIVTNIGINIDESQYDNQDSVINEEYYKILEKAAEFAGIFRANPHLFAQYYLNITLKDFQKVILWEMFNNDYGMYISSRGQGKTFMDAIFITTYCILYPRTKVVVASATRSQGNELLLKITEDLMKNFGWGSNNLCREIENTTVSANRAEIHFNNGSWIKVVTPSDTARGARANILIVDEYWMLDVNTINGVLRRFLTAPRSPAYLELPQYANLVEYNKEIYTGSAWMKSHWAYIKAHDYFNNMLKDNKKYFVFCLPYQIAIRNNLLIRQQIQNEVEEDDFDEVKFSMEMEALWYGDSHGAFFSYEDISQVRKIEIPYYVKDDKLRHIAIPEIPKLILNERRILSLDIALMASTRHNNDASSIIMNRAIPTNNNSYIGNFVYLHNIEGIRGSDLALQIRILFDYFNATDLVIDGKGVGLPIVQDLMKDLVDARTGKLYPALACCDCEKLPMNKDLNAQLALPYANKVIWAISASEAFNTEIGTMLRTGIQNKKLNLLVNYEASKEILSDNIPHYDSLNVNDRELLRQPYLETDLLMRELVGLQHQVKGTNIKFKEKTGARKDRFSSAAYNYWVQVQIENMLKKNAPTKFTMKDYAQSMRKLNHRPIMY